MIRFAPASREADLELLRRVLRVMDEEIDAVGEPHCVVVVFAEPVRPIALGRRAVVRQVGDRMRSVVDPESEGAPTLVRDFE